VFNGESGECGVMWCVVQCNHTSILKYHANGYTVRLVGTYGRAGNVGATPVGGCIDGLWYADEHCAIGNTSRSAGTDAGIESYRFNSR
jgi:hypothetical protein